MAVVAGESVSEECVVALRRAGVVLIKVGVGAGSICTTRVIADADADAEPISELEFD